MAFGRDKPPTDLHVSIIFFRPALARRRVSLQQLAALGTPQLTTAITAPDEKVFNFGIGLAVAGFLAAALRTVPDEDSVGKLLSRLAPLKRGPKLFQGFRRYLAQKARMASFSSSSRTPQPPFSPTRRSSLLGHGRVLSRGREPGPFYHLDGQTNMGSSSPNPVSASSSCVTLAHPRGTSPTESVTVVQCDTHGVDTKAVH